jgi:hypothetical protein
MAEDLSMVGINHAKSVLHLGRGLDAPGPMVRTTDGVRSVSRGVRQRRATAHRASQAREATRRRCAYPCVFCLAPLPQPGPRQGSCSAPDVARWAVWCAAWDAP